MSGACHICEAVAAVGSGVYKLVESPLLMCDGVAVVASATIEREWVDGIHPLKVRLPSVFSRYVLIKSRRSGSKSKTSRCCSL